MTDLANWKKSEKLFTLNGRCKEPIDNYFHQAVTHDLLGLKRSGFVGEIPCSLYKKIRYRASVAHWIVKLRINKKSYKHPLGVEANEVKELAQVYAVVWDAIEKSMTFRRAFALTEYTEASQLFSYILYEFGLCWIKNATGKNQILRDLRANNQLLTDIKNRNRDKSGEVLLNRLSKVFDPREKEHTYRFFSTLFKFHPDQNMDELREEQLTNVIKAFKRFATYVATIDAVFIVDDGIDYVISGKGRGRINIQPLSVSPEMLTKIGIGESNAKLD
jgi:hypothetical protein